MIDSNKINYRDEAPSAELFTEFRADCGWGHIQPAQAERALSNSLIILSVYDGDKLIGFGRVVGDGALNYYIQDLIVDADYRNQNIGSTLMELLLERITANKLLGNCTVGLMAAQGKHPFYEKFGFIYRPNDTFGPGMILDIE